MPTTGTGSCPKHSGDGGRSTTPTATELQRRDHAVRGTGQVTDIRRSFSIGAALYAIGVLAFLLFRQEFIDIAHYVAALILLLCIVAVALDNARRRRGQQLPPGSSP